MVINLQSKIEPRFINLKFDKIVSISQVQEISSC